MTTNNKTADHIPDIRKKVTDNKTAEEETIKLLAEFMGWASVETTRGTEWIIEKDRVLIHIAFVDDWNPYEDWNHWRQVEEKVIEDERLAYKYFVKMLKNKGLYMKDDKHEVRAAYHYAKATLLERCKALVSILPPPPTNDE